MLLLFSGSLGIFIWSGPTPNRTVLVEPETRRAVVT